jgi:hypothetical protein
MQRRVLETVRDHGEFVPPKLNNYVMWTRMTTVGRALHRRGLIGMRSHNNPEVVAGRAGMMYLTEAGLAALAGAL